MPLWLGVEYFKRPPSLRRRWLREKLGFIEKPSLENEKPRLWLHGVSVGEILALNNLIQKLKPQYNLILTTVTDTGREVAERAYGNSGVRVFYLPFDLKFALKNFLSRINPKALIIAETEIWPNLIWVVSQHIPVVLINGRLSPNSFRRYHKFRFFFKPLLQKLTFLAVQEERYKEYFISLGVNQERIFVTGNLKFDLSLEEKPFPELQHLKRPIIIGGSTHAPEEEYLLKAFLEVVAEGTLILAPRHPQRFEEVEKLIINNLTNKIGFLKYSKITATEKINKKRIVLLVDRMGLLGSLYRICDIAVIGGSFIPHGGQNPLEALYWNKPVIVGPYTENFPFVEEFVRKGGILRVNVTDLSKTLKELLEYPESAQRIASIGHQLWLEKRGATDKTIELLKKFLI